MRKRRKMGLDGKALDIGHPYSTNTNDEDPHQKQIQIQIQKRKREAPEVLGPKLLDRELTMDARNPTTAWNARGDQAQALNRDSHAADAMMSHVRGQHVPITLVLQNPEMFMVQLRVVVGQVLAQGLDQFMAQLMVHREVYFTDPKMGWSVDQATIGDQAPESKIVFAPTVDPRVVTCMDGAVTCKPRTLAVQVRGTRQVEANLVGQSLATARFPFRGQ